MLTTTRLFIDSIRRVASAISIDRPCSNSVTRRATSRTDLVMNKEKRKSKEVNNSQNEVAFADLS